MCLVVFEVAEVVVCEESEFGEARARDVGAELLTLGKQGKVR